MKLRTQDIRKCFRRDFIHTYSTLTLTYSMPPVPITKTFGSPVTTFTHMVRLHIGANASALVQTGTETITSATRFRLPGRFADLAVDPCLSPHALCPPLFPGEKVVSTINKSEGARYAYQSEFIKNLN